MLAIWKTIKSFMEDERLVPVGLLLLGIVFVHYALGPGSSLILSELDTLERFLFGFVLSGIANKSAGMMGIRRLLERKLQYDSSGVNLLARLSGFLITRRCSLGVDRATGLMH